MLSHKYSFIFLCLNDELQTLNALHVCFIFTFPLIFTFTFTLLLLLFLLLPGADPAKSFSVG